MYREGHLLTDWVRLAVFDSSTVSHILLGQVRMRLYWQHTSRARW